MDTHVEGWLTTDEWAARAGVTPATLRGWRHAGRPVHNPVPPPDDHRVEAGHARPVWRVTTYEAWAARRTGRGRYPRSLTRTA